jgi:SAM-dependent methyltransferase
LLRSGDRQGIASGVFEVYRCEGCGSGTTAPRVPEGELGSYYGSEYGPHQAASWTMRLAGGMMALRLRGRLMRPLLRERGRVVDFGSGRGDLLRQLRSRGWEVTGVEPAADAARAASEAGVPTIAGTPATVELPRASFDAVVFHHSLEHVPDPAAALGVAREALREGGSIYVAVPNFGSKAARRLGDRWWALDVPRHRTHFTGEGLTRAAERAGLRVTHLRATASLLGPAANLQERLRGSFRGAGPVFLATYAAAFGAYPLGWAANELRGGGEFLCARLTHADGS